MASIKQVVLLSALSGLAFPTWATSVRMPKEAGWSGFVQVGWSYNGIENNEIAGIGGGNFDEITRETIDSIFDSPNRTTEGLPSFNFAVNYTFESRTQLFFGRELVDAVRFDFTQQAGVRQEFRDKSHLSAAFVFSGIPTKVWEDPFVEGQRRAKTDRDSQGVRFTYGQILGTQTQLQYTYRKIDIDKERSGEFVGLTPSEANRLERDGDQHRVRVGYLLNLDQRSSFFPEFIYINDDRDGDAVSADTVELVLAYTYTGPRFNYVVTGSFSKTDYDKTHPIYGKTRDSDDWGLGAVVFDRKLLSRWMGDDWSATASAGYYESDSNIDFYDAKFWTIGAGLFYRF